MLGRTLSRGFSLIELLVAIAIMGIASTLAIPLITDLIHNARLTSTTNDIVEAVAVARSEAIRQSRDVEIVPINGADWRSGWRIRDIATQTAVREFDALPDSVQVGMNVDVASISFGSTGTRLPGEVAITMTICMSPEINNDKGRRIILNRAGSTSIERIDAGCPR